MEIKEEKQRILIVKEEAKKEKEESKQKFFKCESECACKQRNCQALGLSRCPIYLDVFHSNFNKASYSVNDVKPLMILSAN